MLLTRSKIELRFVEFCGMRQLDAPLFASVARKQALILRGFLNWRALAKPFGQSLKEALI